MRLTLNTFTSLSITMDNHIDIFTGVYEACTWGDNHHRDYRGTSGRGSDVDYNMDTYIPFLKNFILEKGIKTVADLGCGDFRCGTFIYDDLKDVTYTGYDAYKAVIESHQKTFSKQKYTFVHCDISNSIDSLSNADLCILKDVIQHWKTDTIYAFLDEVIKRKLFKYILICNCCNQSVDDDDIVTGDGRPLSARFYPLKKYDAKIVYLYHTKEISVIQV